MTKIIIQKIADGWQVKQVKNKGETVLATLCGGNMGKTLAGIVAKQAATMIMADVIEIHEKES